MPISDRELLIRIDERQEQLIKKVEGMEGRLDEVTQESREALRLATTHDENNKLIKRISLTAVATAVLSFFKGG